MVNVKNKKIAFVSFAFSFLFLFNPNIIVIDFLPDAIGYLLLSHALSFFADLNDSIAEARESFRKMILIDASKLLAFYWIFSTQVSQARSSSMLLWTFVFSVLEILILVPAYSRLFNGMIQLGNFHPNASVHGGKGRKSDSDRIRRFTIVFVVFKSVLAFIPELLDLDRFSEFESGQYLNLYRYVGLLRGFSFVIVLVLGVIWLCKIEWYLLRIARDKAFVTSLRQTYLERVVPRVGAFVKRNIKAAFLILNVGVALSTDIYMDSVNMLPDILVALLFIVFFAFLQKTF